MGIVSFRHFILLQLPFLSVHKYLNMAFTLLLKLNVAVHDTIGLVVC